MTLTLQYPVHTVDNKLLLQTGSILTPEVMDELVASGKNMDWQETPLLDYGTVRRDLARYARQGAYRVILGDSSRHAVLQRFMETVRLPVPALEALNYFKQQDPYTYRHILMVFALSSFLAREMMESSRETLLEATAGPLLHDFGKICVPLRVLKKSGPLKRSERGLLEQHTTAGFVLLSYYLGDPKRFIARVARDHHERRDGSGYPRGISLQDPLVEIVAVSDIYDALISSRPYRKHSFDNRTALEEITAMAQNGKIGWDIVRHLVAYNRKDRPHPPECVVSVEKRGRIPEGSFYGVVIEEDTDAASPTGGDGTR